MKITTQTGLPTKMKELGFTGPYMLTLMDETGQVRKMKVIMRNQDMNEMADYEAKPIFACDLKRIEDDCDYAVSTGVDPFGPLPPDETIGDLLASLHAGAKP